MGTRPIYLDLRMGTRPIYLDLRMETRPIYLDLKMGTRPIYLDLRMGTWFHCHLLLTRLKWKRAVWRHSLNELFRWHNHL